MSEDFPIEATITLIKKIQMTKTIARTEKKEGKKKEENYRLIPHKYRHKNPYQNISK